MSKLGNHDDRQREVLRRLGERIRLCRLRRGLTQVSLAEEIHSSRDYVSLLECGSRNQPYTTVVAIANALGVSLADIVSDERSGRAPQ